MIMVDRIDCCIAYMWLHKLATARTIKTLKAFILTGAHVGCTSEVSLLVLKTTLGHTNAVI